MKQLIQYDGCRYYYVTPTNPLTFKLITQESIGNLFILNSVYVGDIF